jgi:hypothetical protein
MDFFVDYVGPVLYPEFVPQLRYRIDQTNNLDIIGSVDNI